MAFKTSPALLAAIMAISAPAFAQDSNQTATEAAEQAADAVTQAAEDTAAAAETAAEDAAADMSETATDAADAVEGAMDEDGAGAASEADADTAAEATEEAAETTEAAEPASAEAATNEEPQVGAFYVKSTHADWTIRCIKAEEGIPDPCEMYQLLKDQEGNSVAETTMIPLTGEAALGATFVAPLETDLVRGLGLQIDNAQARPYPFNFCAPVGCVARLGFDQSGLNGLKRGNAASVTLLPFGADPNTPVALNMSLTGFTAAFDELSVLADEAQAALDAIAAENAEAAAEGEAAEEAPAN